MSAHEVALVRLWSVKDLTPARLRDLLGVLDEADVTPEDFVRGGRHLWKKTRFSLDEHTIEALEKSEDACVALMPRLEAQEIHVTRMAEIPHLSRLLSVLGKQAPPVVSWAGTLDLLGRSRIAFCGSRRTPDTVLAVVSQVAQAVADRGIHVVSGYAEGVDVAAHRGGLAGRAGTTAVLAEGILAFRVKEALRDLWDASRALVISQFPPHQKWVAWSAMARNATICAMGEAVIAVEVGEEGGTWDACQKALKMRRPLFLLVSQDAERASHIRALLDKGARAFPATPDAVDIVADEICRVAGREKETVTSPAQLAMFRDAPREEQR